jgi:hypothetical protein
MDALSMDGKSELTFVVRVGRVAAVPELEIQLRFPGALVGVGHGAATEAARVVVVHEVVSVEEGAGHESSRL